MIYGYEFVFPKQSRSSEPRMNQCQGAIEVTNKFIHAYGNSARFILLRIMNGRAVRGEHFANIDNVSQWGIKLPIILNNEYKRIVVYDKIPEDLDLQITVNKNTGIVEELIKNERNN